MASKTKFKSFNDNSLKRPFGGAKKGFNKSGDSTENAAKGVNKKIAFGDKGEKTVANGKRPQAKQGKFNKPHITEKSVNKKIVFDDEGGEKVVNKSAPPQNNKHVDGKNIGKRWFEEFAKYNTNGELVELKDAEILELTNACKTCFLAEHDYFEKRNPSDAKWLKTALSKGTARDRANAGALLVQSNPAGNLDSLETLIGFTKSSSKASNEAVDIVAKLFMNALLPQYRKLIPLNLRGADWKSLKKDEDVPKATKDKIFAVWHFEANLKDLYFEFLRNVQNIIQGSQEADKSQAIIFASKLLTNAPEKEQMLLSMVINKLGDPSNKVASKALHHLTEVSYKHPAMCGVMVNETEKFLFRNNITEHSQHFALCFLCQLATNGDVGVSAKLVEICFSFFKVLVHKGEINSKTMQAILRCLKRAIGDVVTLQTSTPGSDSGFMSKDSQDTIYRLIHFADIQTSLQTLALLLQIITVLRNEKHDRFYNALYKMLLNENLQSVGHKNASLFLHILHRAVHLDTNVARAQAIIKRLLQVSLYFPANLATGCLVVVNKILKARPHLNDVIQPPAAPQSINNGEDDDDDEEEHYVDAPAEDEDDASEKQPETATKSKSTAGWHHATVAEETKADKVSEIAPTKYDPYKRVAGYAGAEYALKLELLAMLQHYHPTVRVFAQNIIDNVHINFYGDPLRDFSLPHFLERFSFKNPKKLETTPGTSVQSLHHKQYMPHGSRGQPVKQLTANNVTEDERYILEFLQKKREKQSEGEHVPRYTDVSDDEFDDYLDSLGPKKKKTSGGDDEEDDEEFDFLGDLGGELKEKKGKPGKKVEPDDDEDDWNDDEDDDDEEGEEGENGGDADDLEGGSDDEGSISLDGEDNDDDDDLFEDDDEEGNPPSSDDNLSDPEDSDDEEDDDDDDGQPKKKKLKPISSKEFQKKLRKTDNMESLFAAADDFAEMLEETGKAKNHGTLGEIFNQDKSSEAQLDWEEKRMKNHGGGKARKKNHGGGKARKISQGLRKRNQTNNKPSNKRKR